MNKMKTLGISFIAAGIILMLITGINIVSKEKVFDFGKVEIYQEEVDLVSWSPFAGLVLLIAGVAVLVLYGGNLKTPAKF